MRFVFALLIALCAAPMAKAEDFTVRVDNQFVADELRWKTQGRSYKFLWGLTYVQGRIAVCGVGQFVNPSLRQKTLQQMRRGKVMLDGKAILRDITFFSTIPEGKPLNKAKATCRLTKTPKPKGDFLVYMDVQGRSIF
ncbi:hypothetical protein OEW28_14100 [Defluviimonas sp. WL0002]|uniref:Uncharacterized protein n=1 Tax=Albidovulum marisflavi TaxID=2984159 RepID=A0ABT2ZFF9_9RHOB|nr:hypothetical protein [Defluviimonas sp. WL0002]MCV2869763.1 hypothetical protein [Defluviimonas sp. WL0002]